MINASKEDYLRVIYKSLEESEFVNPTTLAEQLNISNAAVTDMLKKLTREKFISYVPYKGINLLSKGKNEAIKLVRKHRIWETFLYQIVGLPWYQIDEEAEKLEHSSSEDLIDRLEQILNYPDFDPHGHPIPKKDGSVPKQKKSFQLIKVETNKPVIIQKVNDSNKELLKHLYESGLVTGKQIKILEKRSFDNSMLISVDKSKFIVSEIVGRNIFVEKIK